MADLVTYIDSYLKKQGSPLAGYGKDFVNAGYKYGFDPRLLVAIAGAESSFGKHIYGSYNPFGWGPGIEFSSWSEAINKVAQGLHDGYLSQGKNTIADIGAKWAPIGAGNDPTNLNSGWVRNVSTFYRQLGGTKLGAAPGAPVGGGPGATDGVPVTDTTVAGPTALPYDTSEGYKNGNFDPLGLLNSLASQHRQMQAYANQVNPQLLAGSDPGQFYSQPGQPGKLPQASNQEWTKLKGIGRMTPSFMITAIKKAQSMGLRVGENPYVEVIDGNHVNGSFHYQTFNGSYGGKKLGRAIDVSGDAGKMAAFFRWAIRFRPTELFYDPLGQYDNGRYAEEGIGNHMDHVHLSV